MAERRLDFERLDTRDLCAIVGLGTDSETPVAERTTIPVTIDDTTGVRAAEVRLTYDAAAWSVEPADISTGDAWVRGGATMVNVDPEAGEITIFVFAMEDLRGDQGSLIDLQFSPQSPGGEAPQVELKSVRLNEGAIAADIDEAASPQSEVSNNLPTDLPTDLAAEDYINPRVREQLSVATFTPASSEFAADLPQLTRPRFAPIGPFPLTREETAVVTKAVAIPSPPDAVHSAVPQPASSWLMMLAADEDRLRKRAI